MIKEKVQAHHTGYELFALVLLWIYSRIKKLVRTTTMSYSDLAVSVENELQEVIDFGCIDKDKVDEHKGMDEEIKSVLISKKHVGRLVDEIGRAHV